MVNAADNILIFFFFIEEIRLGISCDLYEIPDLIFRKKKKKKKKVQKEICMLHICLVL